MYGTSKFQAEQKLKSLESLNFKICIVRPPMVYGNGCKGNFPKLVKLTKILPVFPNVDNRRSMIYIENLSEFLKIAIRDNYAGIHLPQNKEYVNTTELVKTIAKLHGKNMRMTKLFNPIIRLLANHIAPLAKLFGSMVYEKNDLCNDFTIVDFDESVKRAIFK